MVHRMKNALPASLYTSLALVAFLAPGTAAAEHGEGTERCGQMLQAIGFPRPSRQLGELSAIGRWLEAAGRLDTDYQMWHRARSKHIKCGEIGTLGRISCMVIARPCTAPQGGEAATTGSPK